MPAKRRRPRRHAARAQRDAPVSCQHRPCRCSAMSRPDPPSSPPRPKNHTGPGEGGGRQSATREARRDQAHLQGCNKVKDPALSGLRLSAAGLGGSAAHPVSSGSATKAPAQSAVRNQSLIIEGISPRSGRTGTAPLHGATPPDGVRAQLCASAHPARREARVPAGQLKNAAPSGARSAGQSATLENPAHLERAARSALAPVIVTGRPRRQGRLGEANPRRRVGGIERGAGLPAGINMLTSAITP